MSTLQMEKRLRAAPGPRSVAGLSRGTLLSAAKRPEFGFFPAAHRLQAGRGGGGGFAPGPVPLQQRGRLNWRPFVTATSPQTARLGVTVPFPRYLRCGIPRCQDCSPTVCPLTWLRVILPIIRG